MTFELGPPVGPSLPTPVLASNLAVMQQRPSHAHHSAADRAVGRGLQGKRTMGERYTVEHKTNVLQHMDDNHLSLNAAADRFGVAKATIQGWKRNRLLIESACACEFY